MSALLGKVAFITGAGSGIGRGTAERLAREGADVCILDLDEDGAEMTANLVTQLGRRAHVVKANVASAAQMQRAVLMHIADCDIFISVAAVADYRPRTVADQKLKKSAAAMSLELERNPDILAAVAALPAAPFTVGFAAETEKLVEHAQQKRRAKQVDIIAANVVGNGQGFDCENNALQ